MSVAEAVQLMVAAATLVTAFAGFLVALRTGAKVEQTHELVNGHSETLLRLSQDKGHSEGLADAAAARALETPDSAQV